jgi:hypothetical protein
LIASWLIARARARLLSVVGELRRQKRPPAVTLAVGAASAMN